MTEVFTFFELLGDIVKNKIPMTRVVTYLYYLAPMLIYDSTPLSAMVAVLVTFGVMTKHNEVVAFRACGVSLHRLAVPVLLASLSLGALLFAFDYYYVPEANRRQDAIRAEIKGSPVQTYQRARSQVDFRTAVADLLLQVFRRLGGGAGRRQRLRTGPGQLPLAEPHLGGKGLLVRLR